VVHDFLARSRHRSDAAHHSMLTDILFYLGVGGLLAGMILLIGNLLGGFGEIEGGR